MSRIRSHLSYANVTASLALFVALGGTSYAVSQLPRNSVGSKQVRTGAIGASEVRTGAVRSRDIGNRSVALRDISPGARRSLRGQQGPTGPQGPAGSGVASLSALVLSGGNFARSQGTASRVADHANSGIYRVDFNRDVSSCYAAATLNGNASGQIAAETSTTPGEANGVYVYTRDTAGTLSDRAFHLIVSC